LSRSFFSQHRRRTASIIFLRTYLRLGPQAVNFGRRRWQLKVIRIRVMLGTRIGMRSRPAAVTIIMTTGSLLPDLLNRKVGTIIKPIFMNRHITKMRPQPRNLITCLKSKNEKPNRFTRMCQSVMRIMILRRKRTVSCSQQPITRSLCPRIARE
jgi:hypothetical protein